jgi:putative restriction endonuclease
MRFWVGLTDWDWYEYLSVQAALDEVNFWQPGARRPVRLDVGAPFLFKLHAPRGGRIVGDGYFAHFTTLPATVAWETFGTTNGAATLGEMIGRIRRYRAGFDEHADLIGCMALVQPFFLPPELWIPSPASWQGPTQVGRTYDTTEPDGATMWAQVQNALAAVGSVGLAAVRESALPEERYGDPVLVRLRLGQGTFRARVLDAYERRCAITNERTLPVLQASHIKPYSESGPHAPENGLLLRSDLHTLFDRGYITVSPNLELHVSRRIRDEFENGGDYYALEGRQIRLPVSPNPPPSREYLEWHGDVVFRV